MDQFRANITDGPVGPVVILAGEADIASAGQLACVLGAVVARAPARLTVDVSGLTFADSSALAELIRAARALRGHGGEMYLLRPGRVLAKVLAITGAGTMFTVLEEDEAPAA